MSSLLEEIVRGILLLLCYSFLGWMIECCYVRLCDGQWVNRGLLKGPVVPLYGFGALIVIYLLQRVSGHPAAIFITSFFFLSFLEYMVSWGLEKLFKAKWWDYSQRKWNIHGRVCLQYSLYWGFLGLILMEGVHPFLNALIGRLPFGWQAVLAAVFGLAFIYDSVTTVLSLLNLRQKILELELRAREAAKHLEELKLEAEQRKEETRARFRALVREKLGPEGQISRGRSRELARLFRAFPGMEVLKNSPQREQIKDGLQALREKWQERRGEK